VETKSSTSADIRAELSQALAAENEHYARMMSAPATEIELYPCSFLDHSFIYRVQYFIPSKPVIFYVGLAPGPRAYLLTAQPANFVDLCKASDVAINTEAVAAEYAATYLEVTRATSELFYLVSSVPDVNFQPNLSPAQEQVKSAFVEQYQDVIKPPTAERQGEGYVVLAFAVRRQSLESYKLEVTKDGDIGFVVTVVEDDLPLVYGM
jgi:hypothetical protein